MTTPLRIPAVLAFSVLGTAMAAATGSCGDDKPNVDAGIEAGTCVYCVYETADNGNCPFPTCATGDRQDVCPEGCIPQPAG
jgi:hypothetical protein